MAMSKGYLYWVLPNTDTESRRVSVSEILGAADGEITAGNRRRIATLGFGGGAAAGNVLRYDFPNSKWTRRRYPNTLTSITRDMSGEIRAGSYVGEVLKLNSGTQDDTANIPVNVLTAQLDAAKPLSRKVPFDLSIRMDTGGSDVTVGVYLDGAIIPATTFTANTDGPLVWKQDISSLASFRRAQLRFTGAPAAFRLWDWNLSYRDMPQHHYHVDTGNVATGSDYVRWFREVLILARSQNDLFVDIYFDDVLYSSNPVTVTAGLTQTHRFSTGLGTKGRQPRVGPTPCICV